jgi:putative ABC transport system substrate-binding protein
MIIKKIITSLLGLFVIQASLANEAPIAAKKVLISQVVDHPALNMTVQGIIAGLASAGFKRQVNLDLRVESAQANTALAAQIATKFVNQQPDVVVGVGTICAQSFLKYTKANKVKMIFSSVTDPASASLANQKNISGVSNFVSLEPQVQLFKELQPNLQKLGIIFNPGEINSVAIVHKLEQICQANNLTLIKQSVTKTADVAQNAMKLASMVDAILISNDNTALSSLQSVIKAAQAHTIPVYVSDTDAIALGALAALGPNQYALGYQTGLMIAKVLNGQKIYELPIEYPAQTELFINPQAAFKAHLELPAAVLARATTIVSTIEERN